MNADAKPEPSRDEDGKSMSLNFTFGRKPEELADDPRFREAMEAGNFKESSWTGSIRIEDGTLKIGDTNPISIDIGAALGEEVHDEAYDPFPMLTTMRTWLSRIVMGIAILLPIALVVLGIATDQASDTVVFMGIFGLMLAMMLVSTFSPPKTLLSRVVESYLRDAVRKQYQQPATPPINVPMVEQPLEGKTEADPAPRPFTIQCSSCGARFEPKPPRAICPTCLAPNVDP